MSFSGQIHRRSSNTSGPNNQNHPDPGQHYHPNQNPGQNSIGVNSLTIDYFHPDETILTALETLNYRVSIYDVILETGLDSQYVEAQLSLLLYKTKGKVIEKWNRKYVLMSRQVNDVYEFYDYLSMNMNLSMNVCLYCIYIVFLFLF